MSTRKNDDDALDDVRRMAAELGLDDDDDETRRFIQDQGGDAEAIGRRGAALAAELLAKRAAPDWRAAARARLDAVRAKAATMPSRRGLDREELRRRIEALRNDPRHAARVVVAYRSRKPEEATDEELAGLLEEMELLALLGDDDDGGTP